MKPMTRTRRSTVALAAATLVLTLAACGSAEEPEVVEGTTEETVTEEGPAEGATDPAGQATSDDATGSDATGSDATGSDATGSDETGSDATGSDETGSDATGSDATGSDATGSDETGSDATGDVEAARAGLARYLEANRPETPTTSTNIPGCPVLGANVLEDELAAVGYPDTTLEGWATEIEWNEYEDISPDLMGVACGGDSDGDPNDSDFGTAGGMLAVDLAGFTDFASLTESMLGVDAGGSDTVTACPEPGMCIALWHSDGLVLGTALMAEGIDEEKVGALLDGVLPEALSVLAGN